MNQDSTLGVKIVAILGGALAGSSIAMLAAHALIDPGLFIIFIGFFWAMLGGVTAASFFEDQEMTEDQAWLDDQWTTQWRGMP